MKTPRQSSSSGRRLAPAEAWREFIQTELKSNSKLGKAFEKAGFSGFENQTITLCFEDDKELKVAKGQAERLKKKLPPNLWPCNHVDFRTDKALVHRPSASQPDRGKVIRNNLNGLRNPLQALNHTEFGTSSNGSELSQTVLKSAVQAEKTCGQVYAKLCQRTKSLAGGEDNTISVSFNWRLRVGGTRGFRELLLPVFHPVFGIPYIPASSLKGAARAWARQNGHLKNDVSKILGILEGRTAQAAKVEFLDAFPTHHCLSVDVATPQWHWQQGSVAYKPEPHFLLSMEQPTLLIGLRPTKPENTKYIATVKEWLENALKTGIGSRTSSGYGQALGQSPNLPHSQRYDFELWTQGMFGSEPPSKQNEWTDKPEFRPTAVRGIVRYWFRAFALSFYDPLVCQLLEEEIFGKLGQQGKVFISTIHNSASRTDPYRYTGTIRLEATDKKYLNLLKLLLIAASHLGGVGRGSRRPLHLLDVDGRKYIRGCHWSVEADSFPMEYNADTWDLFFAKVKTAFESVRLPVKTCHSSPGIPGERKQDVLDINAQVWLVRSANQTPPEKVSNWHETGHQDNVRGVALKLFYSDIRFKGERELRKNGIKERIGNPKVGGALGTPSFVWVKSIFPRFSDPYQVVTIFGANQEDRLIFAKEIEKLARAKPSEAMMVFGKMPGSNTTKPSQVKRR